MSEERARLQAPDGDEGLEPTAVYKSRAKRCLCIFGTVFFILLLIAAVVVLSLLLIMVGQQPARVVTSCGAVEGKFDAVYKVFSFKVSIFVYVLMCIYVYVCVCVCVCLCRQ